VKAKGAVGLLQTSGRSLLWGGKEEKDTFLGLTHLDQAQTIEGE